MGSPTKSQASLLRQVADDLETGKTSPNLVASILAALFGGNPEPPSARGGGSRKKAPGSKKRGGR